MPNLEKEKFGFIKKHSEEIMPITDDRETLKLIEEISDFETIPQSIAPERVDHILEEFETKVFILEKPASRPEAKRVLVEADIPGAYVEIKRLIEALKNDERCAGIIALVSGVSSLYFKRDFGGDFSQIRAEDKPVLTDVLGAVKDKPADIVFATLSSKDAPDSVALFGSKSNLGANKLFLVLESWGQNLNAVLSKNRKNLEKVDGIFCNDELAKKLVQDNFPEFSSKRIYSFGTPILDSMDIEHSDDYRKSFRMKLGIDSGAAVFAYFGGISLEGKDWYGAREDVDEKTFQDTLRQIIRLAENDPDRNFVFAFRPHPRDSAKEEKYKFAKGIIFPPNLSFKDAALPLSSNEVTFGADIILSICSTENFLAPLRGRKAVFLGFSDAGMGGQILEKIFGKTATQTLNKQSDMVRVSDSPESLKKDLVHFMDKDISGESVRAEINAVKKILDIAFEK